MCGSLAHGVGRRTRERSPVVDASSSRQGVASARLAGHAKITRFKGKVCRLYGMLFGMSCGTKASFEWCLEIFSHLFALAQLGFRLERAEGLAFAMVPSERDSSWRGSGGAMIGNTSTE